MQDSQPAAPRSASRRGFFAGAAAVGAAAAAVTVLPKGPQGAVAETAEAPKPAPDRGGGYTLSAHVKRYYETTSA